MNFSDVTTNKKIKTSQKLQHSCSRLKLMKSFIVGMRVIKQDPGAANYSIEAITMTRRNSINGPTFQFTLLSPPMHA